METDQEVDPLISELKPGDWVCQHCKYHNFANRRICHRCKSVNIMPIYPLYIAATPLTTPLSPPGSPISTTWVDPPAMLSLSPTQGYQQINDMGNSPVDTPQGTLGDWICLSCNLANPASREQCQRCHSFRRRPRVRSAGHGYQNSYAHTNPPAPPYPLTISPQWVTAEWLCRCGAVNPKTFGACPLCGGVNSPPQPALHSPGYSYFLPVEGPTSGPRPRPTDRPGDWMCPTCSYFNYSSRVNCHRCGNPKGHALTIGETHALKAHSTLARLSEMMNPPTGWAQAQVQHPTATGFPSDPHPHAHPPVLLSPTLPPQNLGMRAGDWVCESCRFWNFAKRDACGRCQAMPPMAMASAPNDGVVQRESTDQGLVGDLLLDTVAAHGPRPLPYYALGVAAPENGTGRTEQIRKENNDGVLRIE
ncbi:hypothetical protein M427DRAFT_283306 [Gonapodya prolifera JEL478]|uniref:RanBP2-type domain-containing protein n=1 Tax=Gonapodya prolifera (strain JEL478) TaxID=1344416 RepID=A0A139AJZ7_GONPJ|nr:hypothetical protein M427DRAFT_283306 [Gonapodya prolifera JEL478]|eukprot:KXS16745.1 hypothetical protein M427DRAFT_283306 [Gonapodya prolifera JEL478]